MNASTLIIREIRTRYGFAVSVIVAQLAKPPHPMLLDDICAEVARRTGSTPMRPVISHLRKGDEDPPDPANSTQKLAVVQTLDQLVDERAIETGHASLEQLGSYSNRLLRLVRELDDTNDAADLAAALLRHRSSWGELLAGPRSRTQIRPAADRGADGDVGADLPDERDRDPEADWVPASMLAGIHLNPPEASHAYGQEEFEGSPGEDAVWLLNAASMLERPTAIIAARQFGRLARMETGLRLEVRHAVDRILRRGGTVHHVLPPDNGTVPDADLRADAVCWLLSDVHNQGDYRIVRLPAPSPNVVAVKDFGTVELISDVPGPDADDVDRQAIDATELALEVSFAGQWEKGRWGSASAPDSDRPSAAQTHGTAPPEALVVKGRARSKQLFRSVAAVAELSHRPVERMTVDIHTPSEQLTAFDRSLSAVELTPGPRILVRKGLATTHIPPDVTDRQFESWSKECGHDDGVGAMIDELWGLRHARRNALLYNCRRYTYWDITQISAIEEYLSGTGADGNALYGGRFLSRNDRRAHVGAVRDLLLDETLDYRLALVDQTQLPLLADDRTWWVLTSSPNGSANQIHIVHDPADATSRTVLASLAAGVRDPFDIAGSLTRMFEQHIAEWEITSPECVDPKRVAVRLTELLA